jgi:hypothetical protein
MYIPNYVRDDSNDYDEIPDTSIVLDFMKVFAVAAIFVSMIFILC